jgi:hypothetical protein
MGIPLVMGGAPVLSHCLLQYQHQIVGQGLGVGGSCGYIGSMLAAVTPTVACQ